MSGDDFEEVCRLSALGDPGAREFASGAGEWPFEGFVVQVDGRVRAYANVCPHKNFPLNPAPDEFLVPGQRLIRCSAHEALFDPDTGLCLVGPCAGRRLRSLSCRVEGDRVLVQVPKSR